MKKREVLWAVLCQSIHQLSRSSDLWVCDTRACNAGLAMTHHFFVACRFTRLPIAATLRLESEQEQDGNVDLTTEILRKKADEYLPSIGVAATDLSDPVIS